MDFIPPTWNEFEDKPSSDSAEPKSSGSLGNAGQGAVRGRPGRGGRGQPGRGGGAVRVGRNPQPDELDEVGKIPRSYKNCRDDKGKNICVKFQTGKCDQGYGGSCGKRPRERLHNCATITNLAEMILCQSAKHGHDDCPHKAE